MPFQRSRGRFKSFRRFSATPRRSFRRRGVGMQEARLQVAETYQQEAVTSDLSSLVTPGFLHLSLTPWFNGPDGGFDRSWEIKGILFEMHATPLQHTFDVAPVPGLYAADNMAQTHIPCAYAFWVDAIESGLGAPRSALSFNPFVTTPPIGNPGAVPNDDEVFPTRVIKSKCGLVQAGIGPIPGGASRADNWTVGNGVLRWSGRIPRRLSIAGRQGLYVSCWLGTPLDVLTGLTEVSVLWQFWVKYWYRLAR